MLYTIGMGYVLSKLRLSKRGQAAVELMLLMALLVPLLVFAVKTIRNKFGTALTGFLVTELRTQVRYGYSHQELKSVPGGFNDGALPNTEGSMPITMQPFQSGQVIHPIQRIQAGWSQ